MSPQFPTIVMRAQSDEKLAHLAACGNERAFEAIVDRYRQPLLRYATRIIGDSRADDVVQAAFVSAWSKLHDGEDVRELKAWLYRIVHNGSLNAMKRASSRDLPLLNDNPMSTGDDSHAEVERREDVRRALGEIAALPEQQRHAFLAVAVEGRRHRDVGLELGVSEGAVRMLIHRARSSVRAAAAAFSPIPLIAWLKGGAGAGAATTGGAAASTSAGTSILAGGALKAGALIAATGIVATAGPQAVRAISEPAGTTAAPLSASAPSTGQPAGGAEQTPEAQLRSPRLRASVPAGGGVTSITQAEPDSPAPATTPAAPVTPAVPANPAVAERNDTVSLPSHMGHAEFITPAATTDDDLIFVEEEAPDYGAGERDVPAEGVDDQTAATVNLADDPPAEALVPSAPVDTPSVSTPSPTADPDGEDLDEVGNVSVNAPVPVTP